MSNYDGGPAFPCEQGHAPDGTWNQTFEAGMSLRDYFAAKAMQGFIADPTTENVPPNMISQWAYGIADAMLVARGDS